MLGIYVEKLRGEVERLREETRELRRELGSARQAAEMAAWWLTPEEAEILRTACGERLGERTCRR